MAFILGMNQAEPGQLLLLPKAWCLALGAISFMHVSFSVRIVLSPWLRYYVFNLSPRPVKISDMENKNTDDSFQSAIHHLLDHSVETGVEGERDFTRPCKQNWLCDRKRGQHYTLTWSDPLPHTRGV